MWIEFWDFDVKPTKEPLSAKTGIDWITSSMPIFISVKKLRYHLPFSFAHFHPASRKQTT